MLLRYVIVLIIIIILLNFAYFQFDEIKHSFFPDTKEQNFKNLKLITEINPPFSYLDRSGEIKGSGVELVKILAEKIGKPYSLELLSWSSGYGRTLSTPNTALFLTARTEEREYLFRWVGPVDRMDYAFYCKSSNRISARSLDDIKKLGLIAVPRDTARHQMLLDAKITNILVLPSDKECVQAVLSGDAEIWLGSCNMYSLNRDSLGEGLESIHRIYPWKHVPLYIAFNIDTSDDLINAWQNALDTLDPTLKEEIMRYNIPYYCSWIDCTYCYENLSAEMKE